MVLEKFRNDDTKKGSTMVVPKLFRNDATKTKVPL